MDQSLVISETVKTIIADAVDQIIAAEETGKPLINGSANGHQVVDGQEIGPCGIGESVCLEEKTTLESVPAS